VKYSPERVCREQKILSGWNDDAAMQNVEGQGK
jgi:hypothetical protein